MIIKQYELIAFFAALLCSLSLCLVMADKIHACCIKKPLYGIAMFSNYNFIISLLFLIIMGYCTIQIILTKDETDPLLK